MSLFMREGKKFSTPTLGSCAYLLLHTSHFWAVCVLVLLYKMSSEHHTAYLSPLELVIILGSQPPGEVVSHTPLDEFTSVNNPQQD